MLCRCPLDGTGSSKFGIECSERVMKEASTWHPIFRINNSECIRLPRMTCCRCPVALWWTESLLSALAGWNRPNRHPRLHHAAERHVHRPCLKQLRVTTRYLLVQLLVSCLLSKPSNIVDIVETRQDIAKGARQSSYLALRSWTTWGFQKLLAWVQWYSRG